MKKIIFLLVTLSSSFIYSQNIVIDTLNCQQPIATLTQTVELPTMCDSILNAHLFSVNFPNNPTDSIETWWAIAISGIVLEPISVNYEPYTFAESGCYEYQLFIICPLGDTTTLISTYYVSTIGLDELTLDKKLSRITDLMGRECLPEPNKLLIYHYSDGSTCKILTL